MVKEWNGQNTFWRSGIRLARRIFYPHCGGGSRCIFRASGRSAPLDFVVTSLPWATNPELIKVLVERGVPVLSETPPAPEVADMIDLWEYVEEKGGKVCA